MSLIRTFIRLNIRWSGATDRLIAKRFSIDGNADFKSRFVPTYLTPGAIIYDIGGGKTPFLSLSEKQALSAYIVGIDISEIGTEGCARRALRPDNCQRYLCISGSRGWRFGDMLHRLGTRK